MGAENREVYSVFRPVMGLSIISQRVGNIKICTIGFATLDPQYDGLITRISIITNPYYEKHLQRS